MSPRLLVVLATACAAVCPRVSAIVISDVGTAVSENFDSLASSGLSGTALPSGWFFSESGSGANATYGIGTGSSATGNTYSFGASGSTDRALGGLQSGSLIPLFGVRITNASDGIIDFLDLSYVGEQWRLGATGRADGLDFQFSLNATSLTDGIWTDLDGLDFLAPTTTGSVGALDGNLDANRVTLHSSITDLSLANGASLWLRWVDLNAAGSDDGLGIDDFSLVAGRVAAVTAPNHTVPDAFPTAVGLGAALLGAGWLRRRGPVAGIVA